MHRRFARKQAALGSAGALVVLGLVLPARATNLLTNPSFESPSTNTTESSTATGWTFAAPGYPAGEAERAQFFAHTGQWSVFQKIFDLDGSVSQTIGNVVAGTPYSLSGYEYAEANAGTSGAMLDFRLTWENASGTTTGESALQIPATSVPTTGFTQFTLNTSNYSTADSTVNGISPDGVTCIAPVAPAGTTQVVVSFDYNGPGASGPNLSTFLDDVDLEGAGIAPSNTWALTGSGDWNTGANWASGAIPNGAGVEADFFSAISANKNVYSDVAITAGTLNFNNSHTYVIDGAGSLTLQGAGSASANVIVQAGTQELNIPLTLASNTVFNVTSGASLVIGDPMTISAGKSLTTSGTGTVTYNSIITLQTGATMAIGNSTHANNLALQGTSAVTVSSHTGSTATVLELDNLNQAGSLGSWTSKIDLANNALVVHNGNLATITNQIKTGFNSGAWNGNGLVSTTAAADSSHLTTLGSSLSAGGSFDGVNTTTSDVIVKYTYFGDANLDGVVNGADYQQIDSGYGSHATGWQNGDFNYDGVVDGSDFSLIDNTFNQNLARGASPLGIVAGASLASPALSAVPEPATLGLLGFASLGLLGRRRSRITR